jgi:multimeric flavodoxin WrbA
MNILGISGSPHKNGNTAYAVEYALDIMARDGHTVRYVSLGDKRINPCIGCWQCQTNRRCAHDDDMAEIYHSLRWCDALILGSPVCFGMVSGQLKTMMDRCVALRPAWHEELELAGKVGCGIACGGFRNGGLETTLANLQTFLLQQGMTVINDGFGYSHAGGTVLGTAREDTLGLETIANMMAHLKGALIRRP